MWAPCRKGLLYSVLPYTEFLGRAGGQQINHQILNLNLNLAFKISFLYLNTNFVFLGYLNNLKMATTIETHIIFNKDFSSLQYLFYLMDEKRVFILNFISQNRDQNRLRIILCEFSCIFS